MSLVDLGIIRFVETQSDGVLEVGLSPTYTGCPATEVIRQLVQAGARGSRGRASLRSLQRALARLEQRLDHR